MKVIGGLLFVNLAPDPMPFEAQFTPEFIDLLRSSAESYDNEVMMTTWHANFNWKLIYENLRDSNHVRYLHHQSLAKVASFPVALPAQEYTEPTLRAPSSTTLRQQMQAFSTGGPEGQIEPIRRVPWLEMVDRWGSNDAYFNWLAYPNLHIASGNGGYSFTIENHVPVAPGKTDVEIFFVTARKKNPYATSSQVLLSHMHYSKQILGEDIAILEAIQSVLHKESPIPNQGAYEGANRKIEHWYTNLMETSHEI